jgi:hypothetical protein
VKFASRLYFEQEHYVTVTYETLKCRGEIKFCFSCLVDKILFILAFSGLGRLTTNNMHILASDDRCLV